MGLGESKDFNKEFKLFPIEERMLLEQNFEKMAGSKSKKVDRKVVEQSINKILMMADIEWLTRRICDLMTGMINTINTVTFEGYLHCAAVMINGLLEEKVGQILYLASGKRGSASLEQCRQFCKLVIQIFFNIMLKSPALRSWDGNCTHIFNEESVDRLAFALTNEFETPDSEPTDTTNCDIASGIRWLSKDHHFTELLDMLAHHIFQLPAVKGKQLIPLCRGIPASVYPSWLTLADILFVNSTLPPEFRSEWRFLFSSRIHGESFSSLMGNIVDKGPSVIVVKDTDGYIFGGFASASWTVSPKFTGSSKNFVFSLVPKMVAYHTTGFNDHYQYMNIQQQTFPNGLGMGGQLEYFGLFIDAEYGRGKCSPSCITYNCPQLSGKPDFTIDRIEVWAVGPEPEEEETARGSSASKSVLDANQDSRAMLDIIGKTRHSEGLREPVDED